MAVAFLSRRFVSGGLDGSMYSIGAGGKWAEESQEGETIEENKSWRVQSLEGWRESKDKTQMMTRGESKKMPVGRMQLITADSLCLDSSPW